MFPPLPSESYKVMSTSKTVIKSKYDMENQKRMKYIFGGYSRFAICREKFKSHSKTINLHDREY